MCYSSKAFWTSWKPDQYFKQLHRIKLKKNCVKFMLKDVFWGRWQCYSTTFTWTLMAWTSSFQFVVIAHIVLKIAHHITAHILFSRNVYAYAYSSWYLALIVTIYPQITQTTWKGIWHWKLHITSHWCVMWHWFIF